MKNFIFLLLISCASSPYLDSPDPPSWMASFPDFCEEEYLCAVGEGKSINHADDQAKSEILKGIQSDVSSFSEFSESQNSSSHESSANMQLTLSSSGNLKATEVVERWRKDENTFYSFSKVKISILLTEINAELDPLLKEQKFLYRDNNLGSLLKAKKLESKISPLLSEYEAISRVKRERSPSLNQIIRRIQSKRKMGISLSVHISGDTGQEYLVKNLIKSLFIKNGLKLSSRGKRVDIDGQMNIHPINSKINGFVQKKVELTLSIQGRARESKLQFQQVVSARSNSQLNERIKFEIKKFLEDNIGNLATI